MCVGYSQLLLPGGKKWHIEKLTEFGFNNLSIFHTCQIKAGLVCSLRKWNHIFAFSLGSVIEVHALKLVPLVIEQRCRSRLANFGVFA